MNKLFQYNDPKLKERRQSLRNNATRAERKLWSFLKNSQLNNNKFRRQHGIGPFIIDFYCPEKRLVIELDGSSHDGPERQEYDLNRTTYLNGLNITVIRFENKAVIEHSYWVLEEIKKHL